MPRLVGKRALITGGSSGIGFATAKAFVAEGARVAITGRNARRLATARKALGGEAIAVRADVTKLRQIDSLYQQIREHFGALDIIFANAGLVSEANITGVDESDFDEIFDTNVKGLFFTVQKAIPILSNGASVILNASIAPRLGSPNSAVYAASKAAVRALARSFSAALISRGVRVNAISPGPTRAGVWKSSNGSRKRNQREERQARQKIPMGRFGRPAEIAQAVVFLASDDSSFMLGAEIVVDGGKAEVPAAAPIYL